MIAHILFKNGAKVEIPCAECSVSKRPGDKADASILLGVRISGDYGFRVQYIDTKEVLIVYTTER